MLAGRYTLLDQSALDDLLPLAQERGVGVVAAGVYNSGLLSREVVPDDAHYEYQPAPPSLSPGLGRSPRSAVGTVSRSRRPPCNSRCATRQ